MNKIIFSAGIFAVLSLAIVYSGLAQTDSTTTSEQLNNEVEEKHVAEPPAAPVFDDYFPACLNELAKQAGYILIADSLKKKLSPEMKRSVEEEQKRWKEGLADFHVRMHEWEKEMKDWEKNREKWEAEIRKAEAAVANIDFAQIEKDMKLAEEEMRKADIIMKEHMANFDVHMKAFEENMKTHEALKKELEEALGKVTSYDLTEKELLVNGKKQSDELHQRFVKKYLAKDNKGGYHFSNDGDNTIISR